MATAMLVLSASLGITGTAWSASKSAGSATAPVAASASPTSAAAPPSDAQGVRVEDGTGAVVQLQAPAQRIVSLAPGATELLLAAGAGALVVATTGDPDVPAGIRRIERIGDANAINYERLRALNPDLVVVWEDLSNRLVVESLRKLKLTLFFVRAQSLEDLPRTIRSFGTLAGTSNVAESAAQKLEQRIAQLEPRPSRSGEPQRVFYMMWAEPLYTVGRRHVITDAIERCGGKNIFDDIEFPAPIVELENVVKRDPDVIVLSAPPITARDWRERWQRFTTIRAVETGRLVNFSDRRLERMGPSAVDAVESLCRALRPPTASRS